MEKKKNKLFVVLSTICIIVLLCVPCIASTVIPDGDIVDDIPQGIVSFTRYSANFNGKTLPNFRQASNTITPFERITSVSASEVYNGNIYSYTISDVSKQLSSNETHYVAEQTLSFRTATTNNLQYVVSNTIYSDFYINVEEQFMKWRSIENGIPYEAPTIEIRYSLSGNTEARSIIIEGQTNVDVSAYIYNDIKELNAEATNFNVYVWGIETTVFSYDEYVNEIYTDYKSTQQLITEVNVIKMQKNNSRNTDLNNFGATVMEQYRENFDNISRDWTSWIGEAIGGFMSFEIVPYVSIGGIFAILIAIALTNLFLKLFMGG